MNKYLIFICISILTVSAQVDLSKVSIDLGVINGYHRSFEVESKYVLFSEVKAGGLFLEDYFEWELEAGYWNDGIEKPFAIADHVTYSYSGFSFGTGVLFLPKKIFKNFPLPIHLRGGISARFIKQEYVGGFGIAGNAGNDESYSFLTADIGIGIQFAILEQIRMRPEIEYFTTVTGAESLTNKGTQTSLNIGIDYLF